MNIQDILKAVADKPGATVLALQPTHQRCVIQMEELLRVIKSGGLLGFRANFTTLRIDMPNESAVLFRRSDDYRAVLGSNFSAAFFDESVSKEEVDRILARLRP